MLRAIKIMMVGFMACMLLASGAYANDDEGAAGTAPEGKHQEMIEKMTKELNLTAEQQAKLKENKAAKVEKMKALREAMKANRDKFKEELNKPGTTRETVEPIIAQMKSLQAQMIDHRMDSIFAAKSILTPEQFAKFQEKFKEKMGKRGEYGKKWHDKK